MSSLGNGEVGLLRIHLRGCNESTPDIVEKIDTNPGEHADEHDSSYDEEFEILEPELIGNSFGTYSIILVHEVFAFGRNIDARHVDISRVGICVFYADGWICMVANLGVRLIAL